MIGEDSPQSNGKNILLDEVERILRAHESGERPASPELLETARRLKAKYGLAEGARENTPPTQPAAPELRPSSERSASSFDTEQDPWLPWPGESGPAYEAFTHYLKSPSWSVRDVAEHLNRTYSSVKALAHRWCWAARRRAWQAHLIEVWAEEQEEQVIQIAGRSTTRPHILIYDDQSPLPACFADCDVDPLAHIRAEYQRLAHLDQVLEGIDDGDPIHLVARDLWRAVKADLEERS